MNIIIKFIEWREAEEAEEEGHTDKGVMESELTDTADLEGADSEGTATVTEEPDSSEAEDTEVTVVLKVLWLTISAKWTKYTTAP